MKLLVTPSAAQAPDDDSFVTSGGDALRGRLQIPWYDASTDSLQPAVIREPWRLDLSWLAKPLYLLVALVVTALLVLLAWLVVRAWRERRRRLAADRSQPDPLVVADRVEALPFLRARPLGDLLAQARLHYQQGNYGEAILYLFSYELVELDRAAMIRLAKGKTNRQYLREAGKSQPMKPLLERTMVTFEDVFFGRRTLDRAGFEACWTELDEFESLVSQTPVLA